MTEISRATPSSPLYMDTFDKAWDLLKFRIARKVEMPEAMRMKRPEMESDVQGMQDELERRDNNRAGLETKEMTYMKNPDGSPATYREWGPNKVDYIAPELKQPMKNKKGEDIVHQEPGDWASKYPEYHARQMARIGEPVNTYPDHPYDTEPYIAAMKRQEMMDRLQTMNEELERRGKPALDSGDLGVVSE